MTTEYIVQMAPILIIAGAFVAWAAQIPSTATGYGFLPDMALGLAGSVLAGALAWAVIFAHAGMLAMFVIGFVGAVITIAAQRGLWRRPASA